MIRENVQVYIYSTDYKKVLLLKRTEEKFGYWQPVSGGIKNNESLRDAGMRRVFEKTGLMECKKIVILPNEYDYYEIKNRVRMHRKDKCILMIIDKIEAIELSEEHVTYRWCNLNEVSTFNDRASIVESIALIKEIVL
jgi:8-oxo-dGTP pyrophosphatase MutT (NUDIX family)